MVAPSLYLVVGKEEFLKKEFIRKLRSSLFNNSSTADLNFQEFDVTAGGLGGFTDFLKTAPFLSEKRLAVLTGIDELDEEERARLLSFLESWPATAVAALVSGEASAKKNTFLAGLSARAKTIPCYAPFDRDLPQWISLRAKEAGIRLDAGAARLVIEKMGKDVPAILSSLEMLATYVHPRKEATAKDVEALLGRSLEKDVFGLVDVLLKKDAKAALSMAGHFLKEGIRGFEVVGVLAGQFERMKKAAELSARGAAKSAIAAEVKVHPFFLDKFMDQVQSLSRFDLKQVFRELLACDESIKTGTLSESLALERLVLSLCLK